MAGSDSPVPGAACLWSASSKANPSNAHRDGRKLETDAATARHPMQGPPLTAKEPHEKNDHRQDCPGQGRARGQDDDQQAQGQTNGRSKEQQNENRPGQELSAPPCSRRPPRRAGTEERKGTPRSATAARAPGHRPRRARREAGPGRAGCRERHRPDQTRSRPGQARTGSGAGEFVPPKPTIKKAARGAWTSNATSRQGRLRIAASSVAGMIRRGRVVTFGQGRNGHLRHLGNGFAWRGRLKHVHLLSTNPRPG